MLVGLAEWLVELKEIGTLLDGNVNVQGKFLIFLEKSHRRGFVDVKLDVDIHLVNLSSYFLIFPFL